MHHRLVSGCVLVLLMSCSREPAPPGQAPAQPLRMNLTALPNAPSKPPAVSTQPNALTEPPAVSLDMLLAQLEATTNAGLLVEQIGQLGKLDDGSPRVLELCRRLLEHADERVRTAVLEELWFFDDISSLTTNIAALLYDPSSEVRALAAERLGEIETPAAVEILIQNLTNVFPDVQAACQEALLMAVAERFDTPKQAYQWWEENRDDYFDE